MEAPNNPRHAASRLKGGNRRGNQESGSGNPASASNQAASGDEFSSEQQPLSDVDQQEAERVA